LLTNSSFDYLNDVREQKALDQLADNFALKGAVFRRKMLSPKRFKGISAFIASYGIYSYLPYIAATFGSGLPIFAACASGLYGVLAFAE